MITGVLLPLRPGWKTGSLPGEKSHFAHSAPGTDPREMFHVEHKPSEANVALRCPGELRLSVPRGTPDPASERPMTHPAQPRVLQNPVAAPGSSMTGVSAVPSADPTLPAAAPPLVGSVRVLIQFDVCEEIRVDQLQQIINSRTLQQPSLKHVAPAYVRYQR